jgi:hypothetical protein
MPEELPSPGTEESSEPECSICGSSDSCGCCERCEHRASRCTCFHCGGCDEWHDSESTSQCSRCEQCSDCCNCCSHCGNSEDDCTCFDCDHCGRRRNSNDYRHCETCERCSNCCNCYVCGRCDEYVVENDFCNRCDRCIECCNTHFRCEGCNERCDFDDRCTNCEKCNECCSCTTCRGCETEVTRLVCPRCRRCTDCACNCVDRCPTCERSSDYCNCLNCYHYARESYAIRHKFSHTNVDPAHTYCSDCNTCMEHCRAVACECGKKIHSHCSVCNKCSTCCACPKCGHLYNKHSLRPDQAVCEFCKCCDEHCRCIKCKACKERTAIVCTWCGQCQKCCEAEASLCGGYTQRGDYGIIRHREHDLVKYVPTRLQLKRLPNPRLIGAEPEINGITYLGGSRRLRAAIDKWKVSVVEDGSIGDQPTAFEINTQPAGGDLFLEQIEDLCAGLQDMGANPSQKCGCHVHVDVSDFTFADLQRMIEVYCKVERGLFDLCHPYRLNYKYSLVCGNAHFKQVLDPNPEVFKRKLVALLYNKGKPVPRTDSPEMKRERQVEYERNARYYRVEYGYSEARIAERLKHMKIPKHAEIGMDIAEKKKEKGGSQRYYGLNVHSFFVRKTLEFRHHEGTASAEDITGWAMVVQELVSAAHRLTNRHVQALPRNPRLALLAVMPARLHPFIHTTWTKNDNIINGESSEAKAWKQKRKELWGI